MKTMQLYIADSAIDIDNESIITMTYQLEDSNNPTIIKNSFSKSISLPSTPTNDKIFGHIYELSRITVPVTSSSTGVNFNSLKRTPFKLFIDSELVESGYVQLTAIAKRGNDIRYTLQAFGGVGDFFYNLMYDENGEKRNLASLNFSFDGYTGEPENEMDFTINLSAVASAWSGINSHKHIFTNAITFIPAYNGVPKDFDAQHALVDYTGASFLPLSFTKNGKNYTTVDNWGLIEFSRPMDETEVLDFRSYLQRPALKVESLFNAICNPINNGGYSVKLDESFFHGNNNLWQKSYITLPMLGANVEREDGILSLRPIKISIGGSDEVNNYSGAIAAIGTSNRATNSTIKVDVPVTIDIDKGDYEEALPDNIYTDTVYNDGTGNRLACSAIVVRVELYDNSTGLLVGASSEVAFSNRGKFSRDWKVYTQFTGDYGVQNVTGSFVKDVEKYMFFDERGNNTFTISAQCTKGSTSTLRVMLSVQRAWAYNYPFINCTPSTFFTVKKNAEVHNEPGNYYMDKSCYVRALSAGVLTGETTVGFITTSLPVVSSGMKITKEMLLGSTASPAEYLLSYCKMFNLRFIKDVAEKTITITSNYFDGEVVDIDDRIDRSQEMSIAPNAVTKKFVKMALPQPESYFAKKYNAKHKEAYGNKRVDTNYAFNNDTEEIFKDSIFTSALPCLATSKFYNRLYNSAGTEVYPIMVDPIKLYLFDSALNKELTELSPATYVDVSKSIPYNKYHGYDIFPKMCYFDLEDDDSKSSIDIMNNLVIYNGNHSLADSSGRRMSVFLTDDVPQMSSMNDGKNCYVLVKTLSSTNAQFVRSLSSLPKFLSVNVSGNAVIDAIDFGQPKELYIPGVNYSVSQSLYERYWRDYYNDRLDVDSCKVSCMVDLGKMRINQDALRKFYFFDSCLWVLNKIEDYNPVTGRLTKCEFIKVKSERNYRIAVADDVATAGVDEGATTEN